MNHIRDFSPFLYRKQFEEIATSAYSQTSVLEAEVRELRDKNAQLTNRLQLSEDQLFTATQLAESQLNVAQDLSKKTQELWCV